MSSTSQIIPEHSYPSQTVVINDNTEVSTAVSSSSGSTKELFVFMSPKGLDNQMKTISGGLSEFLKEYGYGPMSVYGQPYGNAYAAASSGECTLQCMRVTAADAAYSVSTLVAAYKINVDKTMTVQFRNKPATTPITDLSNLSSAYTPSGTADANGFTEVNLFTVAYKGRGTYGQNMAYRIISSTAYDKENDFKNYIFQIYENDGGLTKKEEHYVVFNEDAVVDDVNYFADGVINDPDSGSDYLRIVSYPDGFKKLFTEYNTNATGNTLTLQDFDPLLGINKNTGVAITGYTIDSASTGAISVNSLSCVPLLGGNDGSFSTATDDTTRNTAIETAYTNAFSGATDPAIKSKNRFPTNIILDANYTPNVKKVIAALVAARTDCVGIFDCGTGITLKSSILTYVSTNLDNYVSSRTDAVEAYCFKVKDPYNKKITTVTGTYALASGYPIHFANYNGKHVPLAGNNYGKLSGYIKNSVYPVFDEDIDSSLMDQLTQANINYAVVNANQDIVRKTQQTRQEITSNLSELSNVFVLLDIKRDCEKLCTNYEYKFSEASDLAKFNRDASLVTSRYADAQVKSITAAFSKNTWEASHNILHLNVAFVHKDLVKNVIIEIDVNRAS
jgi:hypothetical protein